MSFVIGKGYPCIVEYSGQETDAVKIAAENLKVDLQKVFGESILAPDTQNKECAKIVIRTLPVGCSEGTDGAETIADGVWKTDGTPHKEAYSLCVRGNTLYITGVERRGTIYGIYDLSQRIGVSPWYFWADVPVRTKDLFEFSAGYEFCDYPTVEYRGVFINDEEELEVWVQNYLHEETIGVKAYEKIFELLLRLKANYIWPAMHVNSFNVKVENGALAEKMGIVVGTSHCDMLMRSNNREWKPWIEKKGYEGVRYDYSIPGRNREILQEYWRESVEQNKDFEVCYTIGMRGIHDSGFEVEKLAGLTGEELKQAKIALLQQVMTDQQEILRNTLGHETMMTFVPYKEVLPLYDGGLEVPEDITLVWANDNYGHIRRYPSKEEQKRRGGNGIYYHNSYWAPPGLSYVFLCSIPLAHTANELRKAYAEGVRKLWVMNVGAMKPLEQEIEFFLRLAWEIDKENTLTDDVDAYVEDWINRNFTGGIGAEVSKLLNDFSQTTNVRKLELMDYDAFSQTAYGDEAVVRIHRYEEMFERGNALYEQLPDEEKDAFFQMVLMRIHAAYYTNLAYYYGDRSTLMCKQGKWKAAEEYVRKSREMEDARRRMVIYYNTIMADGKWNGIVNPEGFPPPRAAMMPVCTPPLGIESKNVAMSVTMWNDEQQLIFVKPGVKWFEIGNSGTEEVDFSIEAPDWIKLSQTSGTTDTEVRVLVKVSDVSDNRQGKILVINHATEGTVEIPVSTMVVGKWSEVTVDERVHCQDVSVIEDGGAVYVAADSQSSPAFKKIKRLGRGAGSLVEACVDGDWKEQKSDEGNLLWKTTGENVPLTYGVSLLTAGAHQLEIHRFPSLNSVGQIRIGVSVDDGPITILVTEANDEHKGTWKENVRNNIDRMYLQLPDLTAGEHTFSFYAVDKYFAFTGFAIYTKERKPNNFVGIGGYQGLPDEFDAESFAKAFYGEISLKARPVEYAAWEHQNRRIAHSTLDVTDLVRQDESYAETVEPGWYPKRGKDIFEEKNGLIKIDAATALAESENAYTTGSLWSYCSSESYGRSGLAMYIRERGLKWETCEGAPSLNYKVKCDGGNYALWALTKFSTIEESFFGVAVDGYVLETEEIYNKGRLWRYEAEQIYRYVPLAYINLTQGEHVITVYSRASVMRFDRICLVHGEDLPPMDSEWKAE